MFRRLVGELQQLSPLPILAILVAGIFIYPPYQWSIEFEQAEHLQDKVQEAPDPERARQRIDDAMSRYPYQQRQFIWGNHYRQEIVEGITMIATRQLVVTRFLLEIGSAFIVVFVIHAILRRLSQS
jgi:hypothetical protein